MHKNTLQHFQVGKYPSPLAHVVWQVDDTVPHHDVLVSGVGHCPFLQLLNVKTYTNPITNYNLTLK